MKRKVKRTLIYIAAGFVALFLLRLGYGYVAPSGEVGLAEAGEGQVQFFQSLEKKNYASQKVTAYLENGQQSSDVEQKYEKVASVSSRTEAFDQDQARVFGITEHHHALIEYERSSGLN